MSRPRTVLSMPAYNRPDTLAQVLESLLLQTCDDFVIVIVDDAPSEAVKAIVDSYRALDGRIVYEANPRRLGMIGNWRRAFERGRALYPESEFFAWVSDHDIWHPRWLETMGDALDRNPHVVLAYSQMQRVFPNERRAITRLFDTSAVASRGARMRATGTEMTAGNGIYGLFLASALARAGVFRAVVMPDRQLLVELALFGGFMHVPEILWYREVAGVFSYRRQRRMFFPDRVPLHTYLPANVQHFGVLLWDLAVRGRGLPEFGRAAGAGYACLCLLNSVYRLVMRRDAPWRAFFRRAPSGPAVARQA